MKHHAAIRTDRIQLNPKVMVGKPVIRGTRITVEQVLDLLEQGYTVDEVVSEYPRLTADDVYAAIGYARTQIADELVYPAR